MVSPRAYVHAYGNRSTCTCTCTYVCVCACIVPRCRCVLVELVPSPFGFGCSFVLLKSIDNILSESSARTDSRLRRPRYRAAIDPAF